MNANTGQRQTRRTLNLPCRSSPLPSNNWRVKRVKVACISSGIIFCPAPEARYREGHGETQTRIHTGQGNSQELSGSSVGTAYVGLPYVGRLRLASPPYFWTLDVRFKSTGAFPGRTSIYFIIP